jgi:hypothetical protein
VLGTDIDYMDTRHVFTTDPERFPLNKMRELVSTLHERQQSYIVMVDPAVAYYNYSAFNNGIEANAFLKRANGSIYQGVVWPGKQKTGHIDQDCITDRSQVSPPSLTGSDRIPRSTGTTSSPPSLMPILVSILMPYGLVSVFKSRTHHNIHTDDNPKT